MADRRDIPAWRPVSDPLNKKGIEGIIQVDEELVGHAEPRHPVGRD